MHFSSNRRFFGTAVISMLFYGLLAGEKISDLKSKFQTAENDTTRISLLFQMGNLYIDGPSDSLLYYYHRALKIIDSVHARIADNPGSSNPEINHKLKSQQYRALVEIGIENFFQGNYDTSLLYYFKALHIAEYLEDPGLISEVYGALGIVYKNQGEYTLALEYYENALDAAIELKDTSWMAACYSNVGNVHRRLANYPKALEYFLKAMEVFEQHGETRRMAIGYMNIGNLYEDQQDMNTALEYYSRALQLSHQTGDSKRISECLMNIGNIYLAEKEFQTAREYFLQSIEINEKNGFFHIQDDCYKYIGYTYEKENNFEKALENYHISLKIASVENDKITLAEVLGNLSQIYLQKGDRKMSLELAAKSLDIALQTGDPNNVKNGYLFLSEAYEASGNQDLALEHYKMYAKLNDSIFNTEKYRAIKELEMKYETEKKEQELALLTEKNEVQQLKLSRRNRFFLLSLVVIGLVMVIAWILYRNQRLRTRHRAIELEQKLLRSQMNPHFIFNSLIAIQSYIYKKDPVKAGDFLAKFAELVRITLENSRVEFVKLDKEIRMLSIYLELQALRFDSQFTYSVETDEAFRDTDILIPPMMAQPFVENAIEHGLRHRETKGYVRVRFEAGPSHIQCTIEDNGIGRERSQELQKKGSHISMATSITKERLEVFGKRYRQKYGLSIIDMEKNQAEYPGTKVVFMMPYLKTS